MRKIVFFSAIALWIFAATGCEKESPVVYPDAKIKGTLTFKVGQLFGYYEKAYIVNSKAELETIFKNPVVPYDTLSTVNFDESSVILASIEGVKTPYELTHSFKKIDKNEYQYSVSILYSAITFSSPFYVFGIIVEKIPSSSNIEFKLKNNN